MSEGARERLQFKLFDTVIRLVERGIRIKETGFGREELDIKRALRDLSSANPNAFGTDLPSTRAVRPYADGDFSLVIDTLGEDNAKQVFHDNAVSFYRDRLSG